KKPSKLEKKTPSFETPIEITSIAKERDITELGEKTEELLIPEDQKEVSVTEEVTITEEGLEQPIDKSEDELDLKGKKKLKIKKPSKLEKKTPSFETPIEITSI